MARWEPDASGRLRTAAMELYVERGFELTTVAEIAERAGLTARTFFRHFTDKREVLFSGSELLEQAMVTGLAEAPASAAPMQAVGAALVAAAGVMGTNRTFARQRHTVIQANTELRERELTKMANLGMALTKGLHGRGVREPEASLAADTGIAVLRVGFARWLDDDRDLGEVMRETLQRLQALASPTG